MYLELVVGPLLLATAVGFVGSYLVGEMARPRLAGQESAGATGKTFVPLAVWMFGGPLLLAGVAAAGVLRGWRWWWRLLAYVGWVAGMFGAVVAYFP